MGGPNKNNYNQYKNCLLGEHTVTILNGIHQNNLNHGPYKIVMTKFKAFLGPSMAIFMIFKDQNFSQICLIYII